MASGGSVPPKDQREDFFRRKRRSQGEATPRDINALDKELRLIRKRKREETHERKRILSIPEDGSPRNPLTSSTHRPRRHSEPQQASPLVRGGEAYKVIFQHPSPIPRQSSNFEGSIDGPTAVQPNKEGNLFQIL